METLFVVSIALLSGLLMSRLAKLFKLPAVTAYLVCGILLGPYCLGALGVKGLGFNSIEQVESFGVLSQMALGFIAFEIGNEFRLEQLKHTGKKVLVVGVFQALVAAFLVDLVLLILHLIIPDILSASTAIILGAIATATAPAATLMVVKQYKAKGKLTDMLLKVVALDDAVGLVVFAISMGVASAMVSGSVDIISVLVQPLLEIVLSLFVGTLFGLLLTLLEKIFYSRSKRTGIIVGIIMLAVGVSLVSFNVGNVKITFSTLLMLMMTGTVFCNTCTLSDDLMQRSDRWAGPLLVLFFVFSGAELQFSVFANPIMILIGVLYIVTRSAGKIFGAYASTKFVRCDKSITHNLGITLLPQAGVALGMINIVKETFGINSTEAMVTTQVILMSVMVYELVGPMLTKIALTKAGDIVSKEEHKVLQAQAVAAGAPAPFDPVPEQLTDRATKRQSDDSNNDDSKSN